TRLRGTTMQRTFRSGLALAMSATALTAASVVGGSRAWAVCDHDRTSCSTPTAGRKVRTPTTTFSDWKQGGSITRTESDGESPARTQGSSHSIGADGKVGGKIGPIGAEVTIKYNYTHSKSTTRTTTVTRGWSYNFDVPKDALYRA